MSAVRFHVAAHRIHRAFTDHAVLEIDAAHAGLRGKRHKRGLQRLHIALAQIETLLGEDHDAAAFRGFVRQRRKLSGVGQLAFFHAGCREKG